MHIVGSYLDIQDISGSIPCRLIGNGIWSKAKINQLMMCYYLTDISLSNYSFTEII